MRVLAATLTAALLVCGDAEAAEPRGGREGVCKTKRPKQPKRTGKREEPAAPAAPTTSEPSAPQTSAPARRAQVPFDLVEASPKKLLARARQLYDALEYDQVVPVARALLDRPGVDIELRLDAYLLEGSSLAIIGDPIEAEKPFRFLLRGRPDFDLPGDSPPKILAVFRKVQVEERAIVAQLHELERRRMIQGLELDGGLPDRAAGGAPLEIEYRLRDPHGVVAEMSLNYRRKGEASFSSLALVRDPSGAWRGALPGEWTASPSGFDLEYYLTTADRAGEALLIVAGPETPHRTVITPGEVEESRPFLGSPWFWVATAAVVVASGTAGYLIYREASALPPSDLGPVELR